MDDEAARAVENTVESLIQTLRLARALAQAQRPVALAGFEQQAGLLCAKAMDLPPELGRAVRPRLKALLAEVHLLTAALQAPATHSRQKADICSYQSPPS